jgi:hypothetical protein
MQRNAGFFTILFWGAVLLFAPRSHAQTQTTDNTPQDDVISKRILGIIPNFRTAAYPKVYQPLSAGEKFKLASQDSFDRSTIALGFLFGVESQIAGSNPAFGDGQAAFARYVAASYGDFVIGDYMTEAIFPTMLHQDPRYFRRGTGSGMSRLGYAMGQIFWTHNDSGTTGFNYSELGGNAAAVAISNAYYPDSRTVSDNLSKLGMQLGVDMTSNILKEFWPDFQRKVHWHH